MIVFEGGGRGGGEPCNGLASHPGGSSNTVSRFMVRVPAVVSHYGGF